MSPTHIRSSKYRSIWISDLHLGSRDCKAQFLLEFLRTHDTDHLYLVGDIVDLWAMKRSLHWPPSHSEVLHSIMDKARSGTKVVYIPGNHDAPARRYMGNVFANIEVRDEYIHTTVAGQRLLLLHGDHFDRLIACGRTANFVGVQAYDLLLAMDRGINRFRRYLGWSYWSLATCVKRRIGGVVAHIANFEQVAVQEARLRGVDGIICGHIHHPEIREVDGILYCNDGDWVEHCTALVEQQNGALELLHWAGEKRLVKSVTLIPCGTSSQAA